jgi:citrate synthase
MEEECRPMLNTGLRGVVIADTRISDVQGAAGKLIYRGYLIQDLANTASFEEVAYLLLFEKLPDAAELKAFKAQLAAERDIPPQVIAALKTRPKDALIMDILQAGVSLLANHDPDLTDQTQEAAVRMAIRLIAKFPTLLAAWDRIRNDKDPLSPSPNLDHAANFLYMLKGEAPDEPAWCCMPSIPLMPQPLPPVRSLQPAPTCMPPSVQRWVPCRESFTGAPICVSWKC